MNQKIASLILAGTCAAGVVHAAHHSGYVAAVGAVPPAGEYVTDQWNFYKGECTSYVAYRLNAAGLAFHNHWRASEFTGLPSSPPLSGKSDWDTDRWSDAWEWRFKAEHIGLVVDTTPSANAVYCSTASTWGHVAFVESVSGGGSATISEYNYSYDHQYTTRTVTADGVNSFFIHFTSSSGSSDDEHLDFSDNQIPDGWTLRYPNGPGRNASVANQRFEARQVDTYAELVRDTSLTGSTSVEIDYTGNIGNVYWGQFSQIRLYRTDADYVAVHIGKQGYGTQAMKVSVSASTQPTPSVDSLFPPDYGTYRVEASFRNAQVSLRVTKIGASSPLYQGSVSVPEMRLDQVQKIGLFAATTTGDPSWIDDVAITHGSTVALPAYQYDGARGPHAITEAHSSSDGRFSFVFATTNIGARCLVSWTSTLREWFSLIAFDANTTGTEVSDTTPAPQVFYRTTYLPAGVSPAEGFDYPFGTGEPVPEQITPERNNLYPNGATDSPLREATLPTTAWRNAQDVGAYYTNFGGLHPGEDWNNGSQSDSDVGESVRAVANGQVVEIRPASSSGVPVTAGYVMVVRHWLLNGDSVDSLYVHIAPDRNGGSANTGGLVGDESDFTYQVGAPVTKGSIVGVIGAVSAFSPHLHFEMRNKKVDVTGPLWPHSTGDAYYGPEVGSAGNRSPTISQADVEAAFGLMQADGIIDPSDFIDDHRE